MEMTILYLFFVLAKNSRVQEPNVETDHLESSGSPTYQARCLLVRRACTSSSSGPKPTRWAGVFSVPKGRHMCPVPAMEAYRECCHCSTHSSPLFHFKDGRTLTSKSFRSTFLPLVWWSYVATIQPNITPTLVQPFTVAARTGLPTDTIWNLGRGEAKHTRHTYWCSHGTCKPLIAN